MPSTLPRTVRDAWGEEAADDFAHWFDENFHQRAVSRDEYREVISRPDVLEERFDHVEERFDRTDERLDRMGERFEKRFSEMDGKLDRMNDRILSMTRWLIGLLVLLGTMVTVLLGVAQFTA
jgi:tetrahydromethanopterin S-methyltransferase subunit G